MKQKTLKQQIEEAKKEGNDLYKKQDLVGAAKTYESALKLCTKYREAEEAGELKEEGMDFKEFSRLKAIIYNNIATCLFQLDELEQADLFNTHAIREDPTYPKAIYRMALIH